MKNLKYYNEFILENKKEKDDAHVNYLKKYKKDNKLKDK